MSEPATTEPPPGGAEQPDIDDELAEIAGVLNAQHGRLVEVVERALQRDEWQQSGVHSPAQWLAWKTGLSPHRANEIVRCAERRSSFPRVNEALARGELAVDQAVVAMKAPSWADASVAEFAMNLTVVQLRKTMTKQFFDEGPQPAATDVRDEPDRLSTSTNVTGEWRISGVGDVDQGAIVDAALAEAKDALFERGETDATWFDALVEISHRSLDSVSSPARRDRFRTWIHLDTGTGGTSTTDGRLLPPSVRDRLLCDGIAQPVWERNGLPFNVGTSQRIVPSRTRRIVELRDGGCRVPGCTSRHAVEIHHIIHWRQGGPTDTWNLLSLCGKHHRQHHRGRLGIAGHADELDGITVTDHLGRVIATSGRPKIPEHAPDPPETGYVHASGERMDFGYFTGWVDPGVLRARRTRHRE